MLKRNPGFDVTYLFTDQMSPEDKDKVLEDIYILSVNNVDKITKEYLRARLEKYQVLILAYEGEQLLGFMFNHLYSMNFLFIKYPVVHVGLTIVDKAHRRRNITGYFSAAIYRAAKERMGLMSLGFGLFLTSKCSSPISFLRIMKASMNFGLPKIKDTDRLDKFSSSGLGRRFSKKITSIIASETNRDFKVLSANDDSNFQLEKEKFSPRNQREEKIFDYFDKHIMPQNELVFVSWMHPVFLLWF